MEILSASEGTKGGYKEIVAEIRGRGAFAKLKFKSGATTAGCTPQWTIRTNGTTCREAITTAPALLTLPMATANCTNGDRPKPARPSFTNGFRLKIRAAWIFNGCLIIRAYRCLNLLLRPHLQIKKIVGFPARRTIKDECDIRTMRNRCPPTQSGNRKKPLPTNLPVEMLVVEKVNKLSPSGFGAHITGE